jgi:hypothetical protein
MPLANLSVSLDVLFAKIDAVFSNVDARIQAEKIDPSMQEFVDYIRQGGWLDALPSTFCMNDTILANHTAEGTLPIIEARF